MKMHRPAARTRPALLIGIVGLAITLMVLASVPASTSGALNYTAADQLLADSAWPTIGRNYKHQGWSPYAGPTNPQTRGLAPINKADGAEPSKEYGTYLRSAYMGEGGMLIASGGMTGFFEVRWQGNQLVRTDEFYTCCGGETWVEDVTIGRHNAVYVMNEGGFIRKVVKVGSGAAARWSDQPTDCHPQAGCGWRKFHGFLHAPPALYPHAGAQSGAAVLIISPDGYVAALDSANGDEIWRYRYMGGTGNKESVREKGFTWNHLGHIYFAWGATLFVLNSSGLPVFGYHPDGSPRHIPLGAVVTSGPVLADDGTLYLTGTGTFIQANPSAFAQGLPAARVFHMGSSPLDSAYYPRTPKERWPALSPSGNAAYYTASNGVLYAMPTTWSPGVPWRPTWVFRYDGPAGDFDGIKSDPLVDVNGRIYFYGADQHLYQINPDGTRGWPGRNGKVGVSTATDRFYPGTQLVLDETGTIYAASTGSGRSVVWAVGTGSGGPQPTPTNTPSVPPTPTRTPTSTPVPGSGPSVTIQTPANGTVLSPWGGFQIVATASDPGGIASIRIFGGGSLLKTCANTTTCSVWWNPGSAGQHTVQVQATNVASQWASTSVTVTRP